MPLPTARNAVPIAGVVLPLPGPVFTMIRPRRMSSMRPNQEVYQVGCRRVAFHFWHGGQQLQVALTVSEWELSATIFQQLAIDVQQSKLLSLFTSSSHWDLKRTVIRQVKPCSADCYSQLRSVQRQHSLQVLRIPRLLRRNPRP